MTEPTSSNIHGSLAPQPFEANQSATRSAEVAAIARVLIRAASSPISSPTPSATPLASPSTYYSLTAFAAAPLVSPSSLPSVSPLTSPSTLSSLAAFSAATLVSPPTYFSPSPAAAAAPSSSRVTPSRSSIPENEILRYLVVDDILINREILKKGIKAAHAAGYCEVDLADDGGPAVEMATARDANGKLLRPYHMIIMDLNMKQMHGDEATKAMRAAGIDIPIIFASTPQAGGIALTDAEKVAIGYTDSMLKPFSPQVLKETISRNMNTLRDKRAADGGTPVPAFRESRPKRPPQAPTRTRSATIPGTSPIASTLPLSSDFTLHPIDEALASRGRSNT